VKHSVKILEIENYTHMFFDNNRLWLLNRYLDVFNDFDWIRVRDFNWHLIGLRYWYFNFLRYFDRHWMRNRYS